MLDGWSCIRKGLQSTGLPLLVKICSHIQSSGALFRSAFVWYELESTSKWEGSPFLKRERAGKFLMLWVLADFLSLTLEEGVSWLARNGQEEGLDFWPFVKQYVISQWGDTHDNRSWRKVMTLENRVGQRMGRRNTGRLNRVWECERVRVWECDISECESVRMWESADLTNVIPLSATSCPSLSRIPSTRSQVLQFLESGEEQTWSLANI